MYCHLSCFNPEFFTFPYSQFKEHVERSQREAKSELLLVSRESRLAKATGKSGLAC